MATVITAPTSTAPTNTAPTSTPPATIPASTAPTYVRPLAEAGRGRQEVGGKGESLARMAAAGLPVPEGFHVTTDAYRAFVGSQNLNRAVQRRLAGLDATDPAAVERASADIAGYFDGAYVPSAVAVAVRDAYAALGYGRVAVRSSATAEDLPGLSFAGQQDSFLDIGHADALLTALRRCWASLWTARAIGYRERQGVGHDVSMAVVVQRFVNAEASGVLFTADPVTGKDRHLTINSAWGLGEAVVGGEVNPDTFTVGRRSLLITSRKIDHKAVMTVRAAGGTALERVPDHLQLAPSLADRQVARLAALGLRVSRLFGAPMDVEWCRTGNRLLLVQARPITSAGDVGRDPWNDSRGGTFLWTNTNVGEAIPDVMTPAAWSMIQVFLHDAMATASIPPYVGYGRIGGRIYLNVSVMAALSGVVGVSEQNFRDLTEEVFGRLPDDVEIPPVHVPRLKVMAAVLPVAAHVLSEARREIRNLDAYLDTHPALCLKRRRQIAEIAAGPRLAAMWRRVIEPEFHTISKMLSAATRSSGASFVTTRKRLQSLVGDAHANAITAGLGSQRGDLASLGLLDGLEQLAAGEIDRAAFATRYGHRGPHEFEISTPRPGEDAAWVDRQLAERGGPADGHDYRAMLRRQQLARDKAWRTLEYDHPLQAKVLHWQIERWGKIARDRERARSEVIRYFWVLRSYVQQAGRLTGLHGDVFFLDADEIVDALEGGPIDRAAIAARKEAYRRYVALPPYPALISGRFDPFAWAADPDRRTDRYGVTRPGQRRRALTRGDSVVRGFPGSAGVVEGVARVLTTASESAALQPGEVLVTTVTNVGWTPLFPRAAAVVTDVGAPLSHAAIVARELGIPAVVGTGTATMQIKTGDRVRVDGSAGTVDVLSD